MGPRQPDGSLPNLDFLRLREGSPLIDKGTDVELEFAGAAPDLGALELGLTTTGGQGGGSGASGEPGVGGSPSEGGAMTASGGTSTAGTASTTSGTAGVVAGAGAVAAGGNAGLTPAGASSTAASDASSDAGCSCRMPGNGSRRARFESLGVVALVVALGLRRNRR
jgi:MYXO-CTERM domain-containing protein